MASEFQVFRTLADASGSGGPSALTIGNFDGVHRGHQELFRRLLDRSRSEGLLPTVMTFDPHPARVVAPARAPRLLTSVEERLAFMRQSGIRRAIVVAFDAPFCALSPEEFVRRAIVQTAAARRVLVGENFRFGRRQAGDTQLLTEFGRRFGYATEVVDSVSWRGRVVSSTAIRGLLDTGHVALAGRLLGRIYTLDGEVVTGYGRGSRETVPTLNLLTAAEVRPGRGVYVTATVDRDLGRRWPSVTNIGIRPTFAGTEVSIETFLLDGRVEPRPLRIGVEFHWRLREERAFASAEALKAQIPRDIARARAYWRRHERWTGDVENPVLIY